MCGAPTRDFHSTRVGGIISDNANNESLAEQAREVAATAREAARKADEVESAAEDLAASIDDDQPDSEAVMDPRERPTPGDGDDPTADSDGEATAEEPAEERHGYISGGDISDGGYGPGPGGA